jgi:gluconolactonase
MLDAYKDDAGPANGLYFDEAGNLYACADLNNQLWEIAPSERSRCWSKNMGEKAEGAK